MLIKESTLRRIIRQELKREMRLNEGDFLQTVKSSTKTALKSGAMASLLFMMVNGLTGNGKNVGEASQQPPTAEQALEAHDKIDQKAKSLQKKNIEARLLFNSIEDETRAMMTVLQVFNNNHPIKSPEDVLSGTPLFQVIEAIQKAGDSNAAQVAAARKEVQAIVSGRTKGNLKMTLANYNNQITDIPAGENTTLRGMLENLVNASVVVSKYVDTQEA